MKNKNEYDFMQNRELSWLRFNERVLDEARDTSVPLMERLKFVSIFTSNFDEFFMIRVGSLYDLSMVDDSAADNKTGLTPSEQLGKVYKAAVPLYKEKDEAYSMVTEDLRALGVYELDIRNLTENRYKSVKRYFKRYILPLLSPQIVDNRHPFPHLPSKDIHIVACLESKKNKLLGIIPIPDALPPVVFIGSDQICYVRTELIIQEFAEQIFDMYQVTEKTCLCVTRNADITADDDLYDSNVDFRHAMKKLLSRRRNLSVVRLELSSKISDHLEKIFLNKFDIKRNQIFITSSPMKMSYVFSLSAKLPLALKKTLYYPPFKPRLAEGASLKTSVMNQIKKRDYLISYPYESMEFFLEMIREASVDPNVVSIKITIYRLAQKARLVEYLCAAAENGKDVAVLIELRARFDEQNNIDWSERLEDAGCTLIYGFDEYKLHSKICLITYKEKGVVKYMTQIGTGNYNERTAELYTDLSIITANQSIGQDAANFFKNMALGSIESHYKSLLVAPAAFKDRILQMIERETQKGENGRITMKLNSITDKDMILKLSEASCAGVKIDLIVRGICCILPGIEGYTENITVTSIVGRFLEHSRVFSFGTGTEQLMYISSADLMTRNTQRRIEIACPILADEHKNRINRMIEVMLADNVKARRMRPDGIYEKKEQDGALIDSQQYFIDEAQKAPKSDTQSTHTIFVNLKNRTKMKDIV